MKPHFITLISLFILFSTPVFCQNGGSKLLVARAGLQFSPFNGLAEQGDSIAYDYNSNDQTNRIRVWYFDPNGAYWKLYSRAIDYSYDSNGNLLYRLGQAVDSLNNWKDYLRVFNTYDSANQQLSNRVETWEGDSLGWVLNNSKHWTYYPNGKIQIETHDFGRIIYTYNAEGLLANTTSQGLGNGIWTNTGRYVYTYPLNDTKPSTITYYYWSGSAWVKYNQQTYTYNGNGDVLISEVQKWVNGAWENQFKNVYIYNVNQNNTINNLFEWINGDWQYLYKYISTYDSDSDLLTERINRWLGVWVKESITRYYYSGAVSTQNPSVAQFSIFPNPATTQITLQSQGLTQINLLDLLGRQISTHKLSGQSEETLHLGHLPAGNYLLQALDKNGATGTKPLQIRQ